MHDPNHSMIREKMLINQCKTQTFCIKGLKIEGYGCSLKKSKQKFKS